MQAGFKGHQTRKDLKSKANEKEDTSKRDHEGSVKIESKIKINIKLSLVILAICRRLKLVTLIYVILVIIIDSFMYFI